MECIFQQEMLRAGRRQRSHWLRWLYAGIVLIQCLPLLLVYDTFNDWMANVGFGGFFERFIVMHFGLIALWTPAIVGSAITEEKTSGTLQYLLTAYLSPGEIVLGKLCARTLQIVLMSLAGLPVMCWFSGFGNLPGLPAAIVALSLPLIFGLAAASILASVWCRTTRDAMLTIYCVALGAALVRGLGVWPRFSALIDALNPLHALAMPDAVVVWRSVGNCVLAWSIVGLACLVIATLRLRGAYLRQLRAAPVLTSRWLPARRPRVRSNPVYWRERHVVGLAPWPWLRRWPRWLGCVVLAIATLASLAWALQLVLPPGVNIGGLVRTGRWLELRAALRAAPKAGEVFYWHGLATLVVATVVVAIRASGCIVGEREQHTWQALLQTPMTTRAILRGKQWGILSACSPLLASYATAALAVSVFVGAAAAAWTIIWLSATVFAALFVAAVGINVSSRHTNSWFSLVVTLGVSYGAWLLITCPTVLGTWLFQMIAERLLAFADWLVDVGPAVSAVQSFNVTWLALGLGFVAAFWFLTERLLANAERHIAVRDRGKNVDPQYDAFHKRWLRKIERTAKSPKPIDAAILNEMLALAHDEHEEHAAPAVAAVLMEEPKEDPAVPIATPDLLGPAPSPQLGHDA